jgi:hypothetical protein
MILIALAFISLGYPLVYWGAGNLKHWNRSIKDTEAAPLSLLLGVADSQKLRKADKLPIHPIPFPYKATTPTSGPKPSGDTGSNPGGNSGGLSPNYPGGSTGTIPSPSIPA